MNKLLRIYLLTTLVALAGCVNVQMRKANEAYESYRYQEAIEGYNKVLTKYEDTCAMKNIARSYYKVNELDMADKWYNATLNMFEPEAPYILDYVHLKIAQKDYEQARVWLNVYKKQRPEDPIVEILLEEMEHSNDYVADSFMYHVELAGFNSVESSFSPVYYKEGIVFTSQRPISKKTERDTWTGQSCFNLFYTTQNEEQEYIEVELLSEDLYSPLHEGPASFDGTGSTIFFTRSNMKKNKMQTDEDNQNNLEIYMGRNVNGKWENIEKFPFDDDHYSFGHPAVTPDGEMLFFVSDKPGGLGQSDIYVSKKVNGNWIEPENLGAFVNSTGREMFPSVYQDSAGVLTLYFSTDGKPGMGGLDIYYSSYADGNFTPPVHMSYPINSRGDDFGISLDQNGKEGFISSNRNNTEKGYDRIYAFEQIDQEFFVLATVKDKDSKEPIIGADVKLKNTTLGSERNATTNGPEALLFKLEESSRFTIRASKKDYFNDQKKLSTENMRRTDTLEVELLLSKLEVEKPIRLNNIYYDFDKWDIRKDAALELDRLVSTLEENPTVKIELSSHTDSRGSDAYNMKLSQKRAKAAVDYIISKGINKDRLIAKGYGESQLLNNCDDDDDDCDDAEHQFNRRTEFKVISK